MAKDLIKPTRGLSSEMNKLQAYELGYATDTKQLFIGTGDGAEATLVQGEKGEKGDKGDAGATNEALIYSMAQAIVGVAEYVDIEVKRIDNGEGEDTTYEPVRILNIHYTNIETAWRGAPDDLAIIETSSLSLPEALVISVKQGPLIIGLEWVGDNEYNTAWRRFARCEVADTTPQYGGNMVLRYFVW